MSGYFELSQLWGGCCWPLVHRSQGCATLHFTMLGTVSRQRTTQSGVSQLECRNPARGEAKALLGILLRAWPWLSTPQERSDAYLFSTHPVGPYERERTVRTQQDSSTPVFPSQIQFSRQRKFPQYSQNRVDRKNTSFHLLVYQI